MAGETGYAFAHVIVVKIPAGLMGFLNLAGKLNIAYDGRDGARSGPTKEQPADHLQFTQQRKDDQ